MSTEEPWVTQTAQAWQALAEGRTDDAVRLLATIAISGDLTRCCLSVIDSTLDHLGLDDPDQAPDAVAFVNARTGAIEWADDVAPEVAWSGRLMMARMRDDEETFKAVFDTIPEDGYWINYPITLMRSCLLQVRAAREP